MQTRTTFLRYGSLLFQFISRLNGSASRAFVTKPSWKVRISRWFVSLVALLMTYQLYAIFLVPWIEPPLVEASSGEDPVVLAAESDSHPDLVALFPEGAWERDTPKVLKTREGKLLFQDYKPTGDGRLELTPCTIVFYPPAESIGDSSGKRRSVILQAPKGAILKFAGPLNLARAEFSQLEGARMDGEVTISSPPSADDVNDALRIVTSNIQIRRQQISTPEAVSIQYGPNYGRARNLTITLADADESSVTGKKSLVDSIQEMEFVHIEEFVFHVKEKGMFGNTPDLPLQTARSPAQNRSTNHSAQVRVTCQGPFEFNFGTCVAMFEDRVNVVHTNPEGVNDRLKCDQLFVHMQVPGQVENPIGNKVGTPPSSRKLAVQRLEAVGSPVTLDAPSTNTTARGQRLSYNLDTRRICLEDSQTAVLDHDYHHVEAPKLEYELHEQPKRLGRLWAAGPGVYRGRMADRNDQGVTVVWSGDVQLQPQDGLHVLSIQKGAEITWNEMGQFSADELFLWLAEVPVSESESPAPPEPHTTQLTALPSPAAARLSGTPTPRFEIRPIKMAANGHVRADSDQFEGNTTSLEIWFNQPEDAANPQSVVESDDPANAGTATAMPLAASPGSNDAAAKKRLELTGDKIRLSVLLAKPRPIVREATVTGNVRLSQLSTVPTDPASLVINGQMLQLRVDHLNRYSVDVNGTPARVFAEGMLMEGTSLHLSQLENRMWSDGPGRMKMPARKTTPDKDAAPSNTPIWIYWQGGMDFDGKLVRFLRQVEVRGIHTLENGDRLHMLAIGDQLHASLNQYVAFQRGKRPADLDVSELRFLGDVFVENQTFNGQDALTSRDRMKMRDMTLDRQTGGFQALGPGWITSTRYDKGDIGKRMGSPQIGQRPAEESPQSGLGRLIYLRVDFQNIVQGNVNHREAQFQHFVRCVYGPIQNWDQILDPDQRGGLGLDGIEMTSDKLLVAERRFSQIRTIELTATGNTVVKGSSFVAQADRLAFAEAKSQLVLEGTGRRFARLQHRRRVGEKPSVFQARKIMYDVNTGQVEVWGGGSADYTHYGSPDVPNARIR